MNKPIIVYATFAPGDTARARPLLEELQRRKPDLTLLGRHQIGFSPDWTRASGQIQRAAITLVLIGRNTFANETVRRDLEESRAKRPPNQLLAIHLEEEAPAPPDQPGEVPEIVGTGGEVILAGGDLCAGVERAAQRVEHAERIQRQVAAPRPAGGCNR